MRTLTALTLLSLSTLMGCDGDDTMTILDPDIEEMCDDVEIDFDDAPFDCSDESDEENYTPTFNRDECTAVFLETRECVVTMQEFSDCNQAIDDRGPCESGDVLPPECSWVSGC